MVASRVNRGNVVGLLCYFRGEKALLEAGIERRTLPQNFRFLRLRCAADLDPHLVLDLLFKGIPGVLVFGCPERAGYFRGCAELAARRVFLLQQVLEVAGLDPERVQYVPIQPTEAKKLAQTVADYIQRQNIQPATEEGV